MTAPVVSIVIPTRNRADYLAVTLESLGSQTVTSGYEVIVVDDGSEDDATAAVVEEAALRGSFRAGGARLVSHPRQQGINVARNSGVLAARANAIAFLDDDLWVPPEWLAALIAGVEKYPDLEAFGGPIRPRFEGPTPRSCGRDNPAITMLELGPSDREAEMVWGSNFAVRRSAFERVGPFDPTINGHGDEEDWLLHLRASGGRIMYLAQAGVVHRRTAADSTLRALAVSAYHRGRGARITGERRGTAPSITNELRVTVGCAWHAVYRRCPQGIVMMSHAFGRMRQALTGQRPLKS